MRFFGDKDGFGRTSGRLKLLALVTVILLTSGGCSIQKMAVGAMAPVIETSLTEAYASGDVETAREAIPSQMLTLRGLYSANPKKLELCEAVIQLYTAYALIFVETDDPERAARLYDEGMELGFRYLRRIDWFQKAWEEGPDELALAITKHNQPKLGPILMWTSCCLGKHVLNNMDDTRTLTEMPYVHVMADAAIALSGDYFYGMPYVLKGSMLALTPPMLGGDREVARGLFEKAFEISERRFLYHHILYAQYLCVGDLDEENFERALNEVMAAPEDLFPEAKLMNLVSKEQAAQLLQQQEDLFW